MNPQLSPVLGHREDRVTAEKDGDSAREGTGRDLNDPHPSTAQAQQILVAHSIGVLPYLEGKRSKTPSECLRLQKVPGPVIPHFFLYGHSEGRVRYKRFTTPANEKKSSNSNKG